jgi:ABC-type bacteriocin/lantibiotic exporter with double-glycine peptidase domain
MYDRLLKLPPPFFRKYTLGDLQSRVSGINQLNQILTGTVMRSLFDSFFSLLNLGLLVSYNAQLALIAIAVAVLNMAITFFSFFASRQTMIPMQEITGEISGLTVQLIGGVTKLRVAGAEERAFAYWSKKFGQQLKLMLSTEEIEDVVTLFKAASMAGFAQDIEQMPMGMHTVISEGGTNLSGGQRQRLLISRSLVLKPRILIFDEATSALDNRTQAIVSESLEQLDVTRIVIAHRLSTIRNADDSIGFNQVRKMRSH